MAYYSFTDDVTTVSVRHTAVLTIQPPHVHIYIYGSLSEREGEILIWIHSIHSFSNKFPNGFSAKYFPTVTTDFNSVSLFLSLSFTMTLEF